MNLKINNKFMKDVFIRTYILESRCKVDIP